jgi:hypothetical protein
MARSATPSPATRSETDSFGPIDVTADRYWGAQTERSRRNFRIGHDRMPMPIVHAWRRSSQPPPKPIANSGCSTGAAPAPSSAPRAM